MKDFVFEINVKVTFFEPLIFTISPSGKPDGKT
jgi:hypothetical protein